MAMVTWNGQDGDPETMEWRGVTFKKGEAVEVTDPKALQSLRGNKFFEVPAPVDGEPTPPVVILVPPPSQVTTQHPALKGGEPIEVNTIEPMKALEALVAA